MIRTISLVAILLVSACGGSDPVADNAAAPPVELAGDEAADGIDAPANAAAAEAVQQAAAPSPTDGLAWRYDSAQRLATFGPTHAAEMTPQLSFQCLDGIAGGPGGLVVTRADAPSQGKGTLSFTGNGHVASLEMTAQSRGTQGAVWQGIARGDVLRAVERTFAGPGPVEATIGAAGDLRLAPGPEPRTALACRR